MDSSSNLQNNLKSKTFDSISKSKKTPQNTAILLVSHGSSLPYAEEVFTEIRDKYIKLTGFDAEAGYMKVANPTLPQAINNLKDKNPNLKYIIAVPVFLAPGIHTRIDIPTILGLEPLETDPRCPDGNYPEGHYLYDLEDINFDGEITLLNPIGPNKSLLTIINNRIDEALSQSQLDSNATTGILLVSHGSRLNYNKEFISELHEMFNNTTEKPNDFAFMELVEPDIPTTINKLVSENDVDRLVVVPVFIAPGVHTTHDIPSILGLLDEEHTHKHNHSHNHSHHHTHTKMEFNGEILYPEPIGSDDVLIKILQKKVENEL
ncbi:MAG: sirohydrochlorin nickelochelatase [Methanobacteriaceae archaeon]|nr:sirohydrochlorin nickelochelatase [Methanobacteriaceae archaeon]